LAEHRWIPVGRLDDRQDNLACRDRHAAELHILGGDPGKRENTDPDVAHELLHGAGNQRRVGAEPGQLGRVIQQR
jgi:hypothetical protein